MARTMHGIVYGVANPHIRQHVVLLPGEDDSLLDNPSIIHPGEKMIKVPIVNGETSEAFHARIATAVCADAGVASLMDMRFAEVDNLTNTVLGIHSGDAAFYTRPGITAVNCSRAVFAGCTYNPVSNTFTTPQVTLPPKTGVRAVSVVVPPQTVT